MPCPEFLGLAAWPAQHSKFFVHMLLVPLPPTFRAHQALAGWVRAGSRNPSFPQIPINENSNIFFCCPWGW